MKESFYSFQNLKGEYPALYDDIRRGTPTAVFGVCDSLKYLLASMMDAPVVYIVADAVSAQKAKDNITSLSNKKVEVLRAKDEVLLYRKALSKDSLFQRLNGIHAIKNRTDIIVAELDALIQKFPKNLPVLPLTEGEDFDFINLSKTLIDMGYVRSFEVESKGTFALRGDILDIYPINLENPVRIDFFGDTVERIKPYDFVTGDRLKGVKSIEILSATDVLVTENDVKVIEKALRQGVNSSKTSQSYVRLQELADEILSQENIDTSYILPLLENTTDFWDILPKNAILVFDESKNL